MKQYSNRFAVVVLICLKEIIFYILSLLNFLCLKYMNFLFSTVGCNIAANGQRYAQYGISKPHPYQDAERLKRATDVETRCNPRIAYDRMLQAGRFSVQYLICLFLLHCFSVRRWNGMGWKALAANLEGGLDCRVCGMCLAAKGRCAFALSK